MESQWHADPVLRMRTTAMVLAADINRMARVRGTRSILVPLHRPHGTKATTATGLLPPAERAPGGQSIVPNEPLTEVGEAVAGPDLLTLHRPALRPGLSHLRARDEDRYRSATAALVDQP